MNKFATTLAVVLLAASAPALAATGGHAHGGHAQHGGIVRDAHHMEFELVAKADTLTVYLRDHGKPRSTEGASGKISLQLNGQSSEAALTPVGENALQAKGTFELTSGTQALATITLPGRRPLQVRFILP